MGAIRGDLSFFPALNLQQRKRFFDLLVISGLNISLPWDGSKFEWIHLAVEKRELGPLVAGLHCFSAMYLNTWRVSMSGRVTWYRDLYPIVSMVATPFYNRNGIPWGATITMEKHGHEASANTLTLEQEQEPTTKKRKLGHEPVKDFKPCPRRERQFMLDSAGDNSMFKRLFSRLSQDTIAKIACYMDVRDLMRFRTTSKEIYMACGSEYLRLPWLKQGIRERLAISVFLDPLKSLKFATTAYSFNDNKQWDTVSSSLIPRAGYRPISASGGLVCCLEDNNNVMVVGNPVTQQWVEVPSCPLVHFTMWHLATYPDGGAKGGVFFVIFENTLQCWFDSKLGTWNLGDGASPYVVISTNLANTPRGLYAIVKFSKAFVDNTNIGQIGILRLDLENFRASNLVHACNVNSIQDPISGEGPIVILEHKNEIIVRTSLSYRRHCLLDDGTCYWEGIDMFPWNRVLSDGQFEKEKELRVLDLECSLFAFPSVSSEANAQPCASFTHWDAYKK